MAFPTLVRSHRPTLQRFGRLAAALTSVGVLWTYGVTASAAESCDALTQTQARLEQQTYRTRTVTLNPTTGEATSTMAEFVPPDRAHIVTSDTEIVMVNAASYMNQNGSGWQRLPVNLASLVQQLRASFGGVDCEAELLGSRMLDEQTSTTVYRFSSQDDPNGLSTVGYLWIGESDGLPHRLELETTVSESPVSIVAVVYEYDPSIAIQAPLP